MNNFVNAHYWRQGDLQQRLQTVSGLGSVNGADYVAIFFTGGYGTMWDFRESSDAQRLIREIYESGGTVAAVYHGPAALVDRFTAGRSVFTPLGGPSIDATWRAQCLRRLAGPVFTPLGGPSVYAAWRGQY